MEELFSNAIARVPAMETAEVKMFFNGPEAFTPDADFLLGETDVPGFWVAAGGCAHGLAGAGGIGKIMSEWIVDGRPEWDVWPLDIRRFGAPVPKPGVHARALVRGALAVLRHQVPGRGEARRPAVARLARIRASSASSARRSARRAAGSASTGTSRTPRAATSRCARAAGRARTGRLRSRSRRAPRARRRRCSTSRASRSSRCSARRARVPRASVREPDRPARRHDRLHAAAERARRHRGRPLGDAPRRGSVPARRPGRRSARTTARGSSGTRRATAAST